MSALTSGTFWQSRTKTILLAGFIAGTLDILGAIIVYVLIMQKITVTIMLQGIASAVFGKNAFSGGMQMALCGLAFHYIIAFCFSAFYFIIFPYISFLQKQKIISGLLYGIFIWCVMTLVVLPLVFTHTAPVTLQSFLIAAGILMLMIGLPVSFITHKYYSSKK